MFHKIYTIPGQEQARKEKKTSWLTRLNEVRNKTDHEYSVTKDEADFVAALHDWLLLGVYETIVEVQKKSEDNVK